ncbi:MAG: response regulator, partial [Proteobacteria bacterium]|nr:response regulator [Pseudomonadota bacterium]
MANVLTVDDDPQVTEQITALLDSFGYNSLFLLEPEFLFQMLEKKAVDLILMDIHMPGFDGLSLLKQLKAHAVYRTVPVVMLTGDTDEKLLAQCFDAGAVDFINKPLREVAFKARIKSVLSIRNYIDEVERINDLLKKTFDGMAEGVVTLDRHFHIRMISSNACRILHISEEEALGSPAVSVLGTRIAGPSGELTACAKKPRATFDVPTQLLGASGVRIPVNLSVIPLDLSSPTNGWLLLFRDLRREERLLLEKVKGIAFGRMVSCDPKMRKIFELIEKVAPSSAVVLIEGESGTGKELAAREIHERSRRAQGPFHAVNCAAISANLMESEFFGHERGAFTGANKSKLGRFELANKGTLFLDEIGDIPLELQGKLLRVLQEQEFERVGGTKTIQVDVRVVAASNRDLLKMVRERQFRDDLYYRLHVIPILLPPLRERMQDVPLLVSSFIEELNRKEYRKVGSIAPDALRLLFGHSWPGNIRELYNAIEYAFTLSDDTVL